MSDRDRETPDQTSDALEAAEREGIAIEPAGAAPSGSGGGAAYDLKSGDLPEPESDSGS